VYRVAEEEVVIARVIHGAQKTKIEIKIHNACANLAVTLVERRVPIRLRRLAHIQRREFSQL
jgi:hypothetical protein